MTLIPSFIMIRPLSIRLGDLSGLLDIHQRKQIFISGLLTRGQPIENSFSFKVKRRILEGRDSYSRKAQGKSQTLFSFVKKSKKIRCTCLPLVSLFLTRR